MAPLPAPERGPLAGYGGLRDRKAEGLRDPPEARALVLEQQGLRVGLVALDLVIVHRELRDAVLARTGALELDTLVVVATHTHSGPGGYLPGFLVERITAGGFRPEMPGLLADAAAGALSAAVDDLAPAASAAGTTRLTLAENRRRADGERETALPVLRIDTLGDRDRPPIVVFAYGMHPVTLSPGSRVYSADYVGDARARLEASGWRPVFLPGPLGDQGPTSALGPLWSGDAELEQRQSLESGSAVAEAVHALATRLVPEPGTRLAARERWVETPDVTMRRFCALWWFAPLARGSLRRFLSEKVPVHVLRVGDARLLALPAEPASSLGAALRERVAAPAVPFVVAHANDWIGYVVSAEAYRAGGYEPCLSFHGEGLGSWLVDAASQTLGDLETLR